MMAIVIKSVLMSLFSFYRVDFPLEILPLNFTYSEYVDGRQITSFAVINKKDKVDLSGFFEAERSGWKYDLNSYAPGRIFDSKELRINCLSENYVVVNYLNGDKYTQISKRTNSICPNVFQ